MPPLVLAAALLVAPVPTPIGVGPRFRLPAPEPRSCAPGPLQGRYRAHLELFARRRVVIVPAGIGVGRPRQKELGRVVRSRCRARLRTLDPTGVVEFDRRGETLGQLFRIWRMPLAPARLLSFRGRVSVFVGGRLRRGDPRSLVLHDRAEIVLEIGAYVPPHRSYLFPKRRH
jgi:hypothetical protein